MGTERLTSYHDYRADIRFPTRFRALLHWDENFASVEVADIADGGAMVIGTYLPEVGARVRIVAKSLDEAARVRWRAGGRCGLLLSHSVRALAVVRANCFVRGRNQEPPNANNGFKPAYGRTETNSGAGSRDCFPASPGDTTPGEFTPFQGCWPPR